VEPQYVRGSVGPWHLRTEGSLIVSDVSGARRVIESNAERRTY